MPDQARVRRNFCDGLDSSARAAPRAGRESTAAVIPRARHALLLSSPSITAGSGGVLVAVETMRCRERPGVSRQIIATLICRALLLLVALVTLRTAEADPLHAVEVLRVGGCGGSRPAMRALEHDVRLDRAAQLWASGHTLAAAGEHSGYPGDASAGLHVSAVESALIEVLRRSGCATLDAPGLRDVGFYTRGLDTWLVLGTRSAAPLFPTPAPAPLSPSLPAHRDALIPPPGRETPLLASRVLELVNAARARGARCGSRAFAPAPPVRSSMTLDGVAFGHAADMAAHGYFEHEDLAGHSPADRVRASGYREKLVGENIAYGPKTAEEVVQGWLDSPGHCENIMDPRFAEMGIASVRSSDAHRGIYWVQVLVEPTASAGAVSLAPGDRRTRI